MAEITTDASMENFTYAHLYDDVGLAKTYFNRKIIINTRNIHTYGIITHGVIEKAICRVFESHIKPGNQVLDIGANIGFLTLLAADLVGLEGHVHAFEPNPDVFARLSENVMINGFKNIVSAHQLGVFNENTALDFTWNPHRDGSGRIVSQSQPKLARKSCQIQVVTVDELFQDSQVDLIKIDTEGAEPFVLFGAKKTIENNPHAPVIFEWNCKHIKKRDADPKETADFLFSRFKYVKRIISADRLEPLTINDLISLPHSNILAHNNEFQF